MRFRLALPCLLSVLLTSLAAGQQKPPESLQPVIDQLDKTAAELVKDPNAASFTIGLVQKSGLVWTRSYGYADIANKKLRSAFRRMQCAGFHVSLFLQRGAGGIKV